jgi:hypothetical protein
MQCKDIPDVVFLDAVRRTPGTSCAMWRMSWDVEAALEEVIGPIPGNLFLAKARKLCAAGKLGGCPCGCRGDYHLPDECQGGPTCCESAPTEMPMSEQRLLGPLEALHALTDAATGMSAAQQGIEAVRDAVNREAAAYLDGKPVDTLVCVEYGGQDSSREWRGLFRVTTPPPPVVEIPKVLTESMGPDVAAGAVERWVTKSSDHGVH